MMLWSSLLLALGMLAPDELRAAREHAALHAEIQIVSAEPTRTQPGQTLVRGRVSRIYRQKPGSLRLGDPIALWLDSRFRGQRSPPGDDQRLDIETLVTDHFVEAFLEPVKEQQPLYEVVLGQVGVFASSSEQPRLPLP